MRYDPVPTQENPPTTTTGGQQGSRYHQLQIENPPAQPLPTSLPVTPPSTINRPSRHQRSPFACGACFDTCFPVIEGALKLIQPSRKMVTGYSSGILFALGWWIFIDGAVFNGFKAGLPGAGKFNTIAFEDWIPGILSTLALFVVNLIDRESLGAEDSAYDGSNVAIKARGCAFAGITLALGSLGGALAILSLKYIIPGYSGDALYLGLSITLQNFLIFASSMVFWFGRNTPQHGAIAL